MGWRGLPAMLAAATALILGAVGAPLASESIALRVATGLSASAPLPARAASVPAPVTPLTLNRALGLKHTPAATTVPSHAQSLLYEAIALHGQGRHTEAIDLYRLVLAQPEAPVTAHLGLARLLARQEGPRAAARHLAEAYAIRPDPVLAAEAGRWWAAADDLEQARQWLERGHPARSAEDTALLAALYLVAGHYDEAKRAYQHALGKTPDRPSWWLGLALSLQMLGERSGALEAFRNALTGGALPAAAAAYVKAQLAGEEG